MYMGDSVIVSHQDLLKGNDVSSTLERVPFFRLEHTDISDRLTYGDIRFVSQHDIYFTCAAAFPQLSHTLQA